MSAWGNLLHHMFCSCSRQKKAIVKIFLGFCIKDLFRYPEQLVQHDFLFFLFARLQQWSMSHINLPPCLNLHPCCYDSHNTRYSMSALCMSYRPYYSVQYATSHHLSSSIFRLNFLGKRNKMQPLENFSMLLNVS